MTSLSVATTSAKIAKILEGLKPHEKVNILEFLLICVKNEAGFIGDEFFADEGKANE